MRELDVIGVRVDMPSNAPILLLQERGGSRMLPIWIGAGEASQIAHALEGLVPPRPLTHDLFIEVLSRLGHDDIKARIVSMHEGVFHAELEIDGQVISARPSDVVALAVRSGITITAPEDLLEEVGIESEEPAKDEVERFKEFLDQVNPDDFETP
ncbi:bifunctional nuclease family protein [Luteococcus sp. OSA5]|uniref:bifunctional nuclease family protein n=1 Tax=Luteococcus sp. OSA5 TaxID=3401630 RepID=UPI003B43B919